VSALLTTTPAAASTDEVRSADGTTIGYRRIGRGPGVVLLHGGMESSRSHTELAEALSDAYTVHLPDRRGRGLSGPAGADFSVRKEVEDVAAVLSATDSHLVFGLSAGAIVMLEAARALPGIEKAVIFEPPLAVDGIVPPDWPERWLPRLERELADGDTAAALVTGMLAAQVGPRVFDFMPRWLLERLTAMMIANESKTAKPGDVTFGSLAPTLLSDVQVIVDTKGDLGRYRDVAAEVLLLGGSKSRPPFLRAVLSALERILPHSRRVEFAGLGHAASGNRSDPMNGKTARPDLVAQEMRTFFA
jgi:pimeloyl-ACP methyl ester carboxylesterase